MAREDQRRPADRVEGCARPADGSRRVFQDLAPADLGEQAIVGDRHRVAARREPLAHEPVEGTLARLPAAAVEEDDERTIGAWLARDR
jgi:hypothetical protein